ncbi:hypothetical protein [Candidatus Vondammii sp. HM_W22]|uniref:hypothetical protein n=1 Tax=Candidatus Vondammii sp. HM_W22 TaxID=2687299 RepID=UPI001F12FFFA|nr:hypothetical protein [Candidatus Vondammii sp. HM_W22]
MAPKLLYQEAGKSGNHNGMAEEHFVCETLFCSYGRLDASALSPTSVRHDANVWLKATPERHCQTY